MLFVSFAETKANGPMTFENSWLIPNDSQYFSLLNNNSPYDSALLFLGKNNI